MENAFPIQIDPRLDTNAGSYTTASSRGTGQREHGAVHRSDGQPHAVIIGAGPGGLSAGIHLVHAGWRVTILEKNARVGGRMNQIEEAGFRIDMGPTLLMMPEVLEHLFTACGRDLELPALSQPYFALSDAGGWKALPGLIRAAIVWWRQTKGMTR